MRISLLITQYTCVRQQPMETFLCLFCWLYVAYGEIYYTKKIHKCGTGVEIVR